MKNLPVIALAVLSVALAGFCEAAPKKRTRNQNRIGPYGAAFIGQTSFTADQSANEQTLLAIIEDNGIPLEDIEIDTEDNDLGYQLAFGYRFHRYFAAEIALAQYGELSSLARGTINAEPSSAELTFTVAGPVFSAVGILPLGDHFEVYARAGYMFASVEREFILRIDGDNAGSLSAKGDSQNLAYGAGLAWNINQVYTIRAEYQKLDDVGSSRTGDEDLESLSVGLVMRF